MFSEKLKEETKQAHQSLEKMIVQQIKAIKTPADYKILLQFFYSYYHPLEQMLHPFLNDTIVPGFSDRRKAAVILQDIKNITEPLHNHADCTTLPPISNSSEALGVLYVLEGSTLGGAFIAKMLNKQASIPDTQLHFFKGYAEKSMEMWKGFVDALNAYVGQHETEGKIIIGSAALTFRKFEEWANFFYHKSTKTSVSLL